MKLRFLLSSAIVILVPTLSQAQESQDQALNALMKIKAAQGYGCGVAFSRFSTQPESGN